jgi:hypothetical protein
VDGRRRGRRGLGKGIAGDQGVPLGQRRREDLLVEAELRAAQRGEGGEDLVPGLGTADDGIAAVDVGGDVVEPRPGERCAERLRGQLRLPADTAEEEEVNRAFHSTPK